MTYVLCTSVCTLFNNVNINLSEVLFTIFLASGFVFKGAVMLLHLLFYRALRYFTEHLMCVRECVRNVKALTVHSHKCTQKKYTVCFT